VLGIGIVADDFTGRLVCSVPFWDGAFSAWNVRKSLSAVFFSRVRKKRYRELSNGVFNWLKSLPDHGGRPHSFSKQCIAVKMKREREENM
jgi:hypothetical protein